MIRSAFRHYQKHLQVAPRRLIQKRFGSGGSTEHGKNGKFMLPEEIPSNYPYGVVSSITLLTIFALTLPPADFYPFVKKAGAAGEKYHSKHTKLVTGTSELAKSKDLKHAEREIEVSSSAATEQEPTENIEPVVPSEDEAVPEQAHGVKEPVPNEKPSHDLIKAKYVLVGGGAASYSAAKAIYDREPNADVLIVSKEDHPPYMRPPLSKELWFSENPSELKFKDWAGTEREVVLLPVDEYNSDFDTVVPKKSKLLLGHAVKAIDVEAHVLVLDDGRKIKYEKVLLATGGTPKVLKWVKQLPEDLRKHFSTFRNIDDLKKLEQIARQGKNIVIYGGGFLGSELSCGLARFGKKFGSKVTQVFTEDGNMGLIFPKYLSAWTTRKVSEEGVVVKPSKQISQVSLSDSNSLNVQLSDGSIISADHVVLAVGIEPAVDFVKNSSLELDSTRGGILANAELEARKDVFVAGDVLSYHDVTLGRRRVEHHDNAVLSGRIAGGNMTGMSKAYKHQSMFWSDLGPQIGYEAVGILDSSLKTVGIWAKATPADTPQAAVAENPSDIRIAEVQTLKDSSDKLGSEPHQTQSNEKAVVAQSAEANAAENYGKGVVLYLKDDVVIGALLWNMFNRTNVARKLIQEKSKVTDVASMAALFKIHENDH